MVSVGTFSARRVWVVAKRILRQIGRDRRTLGMMLAMPAVIMFIFGFALSGEVKNLPVSVDNRDTGYTANLGPGGVLRLDVGEKLVESLRGDDRVKLTLGDYDSGKAGVESGLFSAAVLIPEGFSEDAFLRSRGGGEELVLDIYIDGTKPSIKGSLLGSIQSALQGAIGGGGVDMRIQLAFGGAEYSGLDVSIPSVIGFVLTFLVLLVSMIIITRENTGGTLQRLFSTPLTAFERLLGYVVALLVLGMVMAGMIFAIGVWVFHTAVRGSLPLLFLLAALYALTHVLLAVFLSNFAKNELQAVQMAPLISLPSMALSGMMVPVNSLPDFIQPLARLIPLYYGNRIFEGLMLKGYGVSELTNDILIVAGMAVIFLVLALMTVKDRIDA